MSQDPRLWPLNEDNDGICRCGRLATDISAQAAVPGRGGGCEWHPAVAIRRLQRLRAAEQRGELGMRDELLAELVQLSEQIEGVPASSEPGKPPHDPVDHPQHYTSVVPGIECIEVVEHMTFLRGNAIKYLWRAGAKGDVVEDLRKAVWYIEREIANLTAAQQLDERHLVRGAVVVGADGQVRS